MECEAGTVETQRYIQDLRFQYANELFVEHPGWSMDAISKECGLSRTVFYTFFVRKFGVKLEELRKDIRKKARK